MAHKENCVQQMVPCGQSSLDLQVPQSLRSGGALGMGTAVQVCPVQQSPSTEQKPLALRLPLQGPGSGPGSGWGSGPGSGAGSGVLCSAGFSDVFGSGVPASPASPASEGLEASSGEGSALVGSGAGSALVGSGSGLASGGGSGPVHTSLTQGSWSQQSAPLSQVIPAEVLRRSMQEEERPTSRSRPRVAIQAVRRRGLLVCWGCVLCARGELRDMKGTLTWCWLGGGDHPRRC